MKLLKGKIAWAGDGGSRVSPALRAGPLLRRVPDSRQGHTPNPSEDAGHRHWLQKAASENLLQQCISMWLVLVLS